MRYASCKVWHISTHLCKLKAPVSQNETGVDLSQSELRLLLLQVVSSNKYFSVGVQSPTEINAPRGCAVILKRRCQLALTKITHQVSRAFDLNMLEYTSCSYDMISTDIYGTVSNTASRPGIIDHSISGIDCNVADTAFTISSIEDQISTLERIGINRSSQSVICSQIDRGIFMNCQCMVYDIGRWINTGSIQALINQTGAVNVRSRSSRAANFIASTAFL